MIHRRLLAIGVALAAVLRPTPPHPVAHARDDASLVDRLRGHVAEADLGDQLGIAVRDVENGREIFSHHKKLPLNPASNMKLVTSAAALHTLGPDFRMRTGLYGKPDDQGRVPELVLRGRGDPTLEMRDLVALAEELADKGVQRVGTVGMDGSYFDDRILPPAFDQQPDENAAFRAPVAAASVNAGAYELRVLPGPKPGKRAAVRLAAEGYFAMENEISTSEGGAPDVVAIQRPADDTHMELLLRGTVPAGVLGVSYRRRVEQPLAYAGHALAEALARAGITVGGDVVLGRESGERPLLASRQSPSLARILHRLGKHSDNFVAEMLLKVMGAEEQTPGTSKRGLKVVRRTLEAAGIDTSNVTLVNGSGLFEGNEIAANHLARLLAEVYRNPGLRPDYLSQLAIGGVDGTLHQRLEDLPGSRIVRAKTGTLAGAIALSGYVLGPEPGQAWAFSFLANGVRGKHHAARTLADDLVAEMARHLYPDK